MDDPRPQSLIPLYDCTERLLGFYAPEDLAPLVREGLATPVRSGCRKRMLRRVILRDHPRAILRAAEVVDLGRIATRREMAGVPIMQAWRLLTRRVPLKATA